MSAVNEAEVATQLTACNICKPAIPSDFLCIVTGTGDRTYENIVVLPCLQYCTDTALPKECQLKVKRTQGMLFDS